MIVDSFGRIHNYLRISLTDNCNLRCFYCMPEEDYEFTPVSRLMQADEIESLAKIFVSEGVTKIRLTGGEPLIRKDAERILLSLSKLPVTLTLTTNGIRLHSFMDVLKDAKVRSLNISLDTLHRDKFLFLSRRDQFQQVYDNIQLCLHHKFHVKINVVMMKDFNDDEILDFIEWTKETPVHIRFIEFMPFQGNKWTSNKVITLEEILDKVGSKYEISRLQDKKNDTAKKFAIISTMSAPFCQGCNRIRLTADGKIKNCLFSKSETDILSSFRKGDDVLPIIRRCIAAKAKELGGQLSTDFVNLMAEDIDNRSMITIGG
jgi:GTP 3',8-cyclase